MRILFLTSRFPYPLEKGDKLRAFYLIAGLSRKHKITLASVNDSEISPEDLDALKPFCQRILVHSLSKGMRIGNLIRALFNGKPFQAEYFFAEAFKEKIIKIIADEKPDMIFCQLLRMAEYVKDVDSVTKTLDYQDAFSMGYERQAKTETLFKKIPVMIEAKRVKKYERQMFDRFEKKLIVSSQDRDLIDHPRREEIKVIPVGVDTEFYKPLKLEKKYDLVFAGNMNYPQNIQSVLYIVKEILPLLRKKKPDITLVIAGADPAKEILRLANNNITVTGWVDDIREIICQSRIHLAPMLISIGMQNKILQAMAMEVPCVVSPLANGPIQARDGESILVADNPQHYVEHILHLLTDTSYYTKMTKSSRVFIQNNFTWEKIWNKLEEAIKAKP